MYLSSREVFFFRAGVMTAMMLAFFGGWLRVAFENDRGGGNLWRRSESRAALLWFGGSESLMKRMRNSI